jgi:hypothetical protein
MLCRDQKGWDDEEGYTRLRIGLANLYESNSGSRIIMEDTYHAINHLVGPCELDLGWLLLV